MMRRLQAVLSALFDGPLWKAMAAAAAVALALWLAYEMYGETVVPLLDIGATAIVLYFLIRPLRYAVLRFRSASAKARMLAVLAALAILHLFAFALFFALPFAVEGVWNLFSELFEIDFWLFPAIFVLLWAFASVLVVLRDRNVQLRLLSLGVCAVLLVIAIGAMRMAREAQSLFASFGADLPTPTLLFLQDTWAFFVLPVAAAVAAGVLFAYADSAARIARYASAIVVGLAASANLALFGGLGSLYLPLFRCGSFEFVDNGYTRLHAAAALGREASARRQIGAGASVNARDASGATPLHLAVSGGNLPLVHALLAGGSNAKAATIYGETPMHAAAALGRIDIAERLLASGATVNATDVRGGTPLDRAYENKHVRLAALLEGHGGFRSTRESRQLAVERAKAQVQAAAPQAIQFGSCGAV